MAPFKAHGEAVSDPLEYAVADAPIFDATAFRRLDMAGALTANAPGKAPSNVQLNFEDLACFEVVDEQFAHLGITFSNAIALQPSNPAYPPRIDKTTVLMGAPKSGCLEASFRRPVRFVSGSITSSRRTVLSAFDADNQPLTQAESPGSNLAGSEAETPPNVELSLNTANIHRIVFRSFDGQLTLGDLSFEF